jgi:hypothetical protein
MQNTKQIYISLPVADIAKSTDFYTKLGFSIQPDWSMEGQVSCMKWSETIYVMLCNKELYKTYINGKDIADASKNSHSMMSFTMENRENIDSLVKIATENGGGNYIYNSGMDFMYNMMISDLDGHVFELVYMDMSKFPQNQ